MTEVIPTEEMKAGDWASLLGADDLEAILTIATNGQSGRVTPYELRALIAVYRAYEPMREALEKVMVGGNHLGLIIGVDHPPYTASHEEARTHYADAIWTYEAWCCWKTIMEARPALSTLPVNDRQTSDDAGRLRDDALANLKWEARFLLNRLSDLSFDDLDDLTRDFNGHVEPSISRLDRILSGMEARAALKGVPQPATPKEAAMTEAQIKYMVDRFLMWKLPEHFNPDGGISFEPVGSKGTPFEYRREPVGTNLLSAEQATAMVRHMLEGLPQPASDDYQADAGAPALSETVSVRSEQKRRQKNMLTDLVDAVLYLNDIVGDLDETGKTSSTRLGHLQRAVDRLLESISSADTGAKLNFSNDAERDGVSLKSDTSSQPASEAGKLSTDEVL